MTAAVERELRRQLRALDPAPAARPSGIVYASTPHKAADLFARHFTGYACHPLRRPAHG